MITKLLTAILLCAGSLLAQTVRVANLSTVPFEGWKRCTVDVMPPHRVGAVTTDAGELVGYVLGRICGKDTRIIDLHVRLAPKQELALNLKDAKPWDWVRPTLPADHVEWFGGVVSIAGKQMKRLSLEGDGAGYSAHWQQRVGPMLVVDLWATWYPSEPSWCSGEVLVTASNPTVPDMTAVVPKGFNLRFGKALIAVPGSMAAGSPLIPEGETFGDGQARAIPVTFVFWQHLQAPETWASAAAAANLDVVACGISHLLQQGNPRYPSDFDAARWAADRRDESIRRIHTWDVGVVGPNKRSGDTGAQEDQTFVRGEALLPGGLGAVTVTYLAALKLAARPCHHRDADGAQVDPANHPSLVYWDGRCHIPGVSPDQLGKPRGLSDNETSKWWGPDVEHWIYNTLAAATRYTGSPACQHLLAAQARIYLLQWTVDPRLIYQSVPFAARAQGWEGIMVCHLDDELEDRELARLVLDRARGRAEIYVRAFAGLADDVWDWRNDPRIGGVAWVPWQQAVGAYGLDLMCERIGHKEGRAIALRAARAVLRDAWKKQGDRWISANVVTPDPANTVWDSAYQFFGMPLSVATVLRHDKGDQKAMAIWAQLLQEATEPHQIRWIAPGIR